MRSPRIHDRNRRTPPPLISCENAQAHCCHCQDPPLVDAPSIPGRPQSPLGVQCEPRRDLRTCTASGPLPMHCPGWRLRPVHPAATRERSLDGCAACATRACTRTPDRWFRGATGTGCPCSPEDSSRSATPARRHAFGQSQDVTVRRERAPVNMVGECVEARAAAIVPRFSRRPSEVRTRRECRDWVCASQPWRCLAPSSGRFWSRSPAIRTRTFRGHRSGPVNASRPPATAAVSSIGPKNNGVDRRGRLVAGWSLTNGSATHLVSVAVSCGSMAARCMRQCWRSGSGKPPARR